MGGDDGFTHRAIDRQLCGIGIHRTGAVPYFAAEHHAVSVRKRRHRHRRRGKATKIRGLDYAPTCPAVSTELPLVTEAAAGCCYLEGRGGVFIYRHALRVRGNYRRFTDIVIG